MSFFLSTFYKMATVAFSLFFLPHVFGLKGDIFCSQVHAIQQNTIRGQNTTEENRFPLYTPNWWQANIPSTDIWIQRKASHGFLSDIALSESSVHWDISEQTWFSDCVKKVRRLLENFETHSRELASIVLKFRKHFIIWYPIARNRFSNPIQPPQMSKIGSFITVYWSNYGFRLSHDCDTCHWFIQRHSTFSIISHPRVFQMPKNCPFILI